jgi:uncharacterized protein (TIGR00725 family)
VNRPLYVGVIGGRSCSPDTAALAFEVGRRIAAEGWILVCGGGGGVMAEACRGAAKAGGLTLGILPGMNREDANPHLTCSVVTGLGEMRNSLVVRSSRAVIALAGSCGTLAEIALANCAGIPVVGLSSWRCRPGEDTDHPGLYSFEASSAAEAVDWIKQRLGPES